MLGSSAEERGDPVVGGLCPGEFLDEEPADVGQLRCEDMSSEGWRMGAVERLRREGTEKETGSRRIDDEGWRKG